MCDLNISYYGGNDWTLVTVVTVVMVVTVVTRALSHSGVASTVHNMADRQGRQRRANEWSKTSVFSPVTSLVVSPPIRFPLFYVLVL